MPSSGSARWPPPRCMASQHGLRNAACMQHASNAADDPRQEENREARGANMPRDNRAPSRMASQHERSHRKRSGSNHDARKQREGRSAGSRRSPGERGGTRRRIGLRGAHHRGNRAHPDGASQLLQRIEHRAAARALRRRQLRQAVGHSRAECKPCPMPNST